MKDYSLTECVDMKSDKKYRMTNRATGLHYDECYETIQKKQSAGPGAYQLSNFHSCNCEIPDVQHAAIDRPGFAAKQFRDGYGWTGVKGCNVDKDSSLRNCKNLTNLKVINQLFERPFLSIPYMGKGSGNPKCETMLQPGEDTFQQKPCNSLSGIDVTDYRMIPLVPSLKEKIQNEKHLIEENNGWVRSGLPSRQMIRNKDYLESCGYKHDGKHWKRN